MDFWTSCKQRHLFQNVITLADLFARTVDSHASMTEVLDDSTAYSSLLYSVLQSIIKVRLYCSVDRLMTEAAWKN